MKSLRNITTEFVSKNKLALFMLFVFLLLASFFEIYPVLFMQRILDGLTQSIDFVTILLSLVYWYGCRLIGALFSTLSGRMSSSLSSKYSRRIRRAIFDRITLSSYAVAEDKSAAENIYTSIDDVNSLGSAILSPIQYMAQNLFVFIWATVYLIKLDYILYLMCVPLGVVMWFFGNVVSRKTKNNEVIKRTVESNVAEVIDGFFSGAREVLTLGLVDRIRCVFDGLNEELRNRQYRNGWLQSALSSLLDILWPIATVITLGLGGYRVSTGQLTIGGLVAFMWYIQWAINPVSQFAVYKNQIQIASVSYKRIDQLFETYGTSSRTPKTCLEKISEITFDRVSYSYENSGRGIQDVSFSLKAGTFYSIVGKTGSGKSTIGKLISGLYEPESGTIELNRTDIIPASLIGNLQIMSAFSDAYIFTGSIIDNITLFSDEDTLKQGSLDEVFSVLSLDDLRNIGNLSSQGEHGLSTGQKQRIAIGRMLYHDPDVFIIDEATSAVDSSTEKSILDKLSALAADHIVVLISHRLSSILRTEYCYVVDNGCIVSQGEPMMLLENSNEFKQLFANQMMKGEESQ